METSLVYIATNKVNGKQYVGLTAGSLRVRWGQHVWAARSKPRSYFHRAIAKHGVDAFDVRHVASATSAAHLADLERIVIADIQPEYNQTNGGEYTTGRKYTPDTIARIKAKNTGLKRTPEVVAANAARKKAWWAAHPEAKHRLQDIRGRVDNVKRLDAVRAALAGKHLSPEHRAKMSKSRMGLVYSAEVIARMAKAKRRAIYCATNGVTYDCRVAAAEATGVSPRTVWRICNGEGISRQAFTFNYV